MAQNETHVEATPERVFEVLSDARHYGDWVVGSRRIRGADAEFPAVGWRFHHQVGVPPFVLNDHTEVLENRPPTLLVLRAKPRPLGTARVDLRLAPDGRGTHVVMTEVAGDPFSKLLLNR